jgi:hypothetical protein
MSALNSPQGNGRAALCWPWAMWFCETVSCVVPLTVVISYIYTLACGLNVTEGRKPKKMKKNDFGDILQVVAAQ